MICISKLENRINKLKEGCALRLSHAGLGFDVIIKMNQQQNRIYVERYIKYNSEVSEKMISHFLLWDAGTWQLVEELPKEEIVKVVTPGKYKEI